MSAYHAMSLTLASLCGCAALALAGCGGSGGGSTSTDTPPPSGGGGSTSAAPSATGTWSGSYTTTAVAGIAGSGSGLALMTPMTLNALLTSTPAVIRTVTFTITFTQDGTNITGSYEDSDGRAGTVTGTLTAAGALSTTTTFVTGAEGTLALNGTVTNTSGTNSISAATVTEAYTANGTTFSFSGSADMTGTGTGGAPGTVAAPETRFQGLWQSVDTGINDEDHDGDGSIISVTKNSDGSWSVGNALGEAFAGTTASQSESTLTFIGDDGNYGGVQSWFKEVWTIKGTVVISEASYLEGPTTRPSASATGWISRGSHAWVRKDLADIATLGAQTAIRQTDYDQTAVSPTGADITTIKMLISGDDTITVMPLFSADLDTTKGYKVRLADESQGDDGALSVWLSYNTGSQQWDTTFKRGSTIITGLTASVAPAMEGSSASITFDVPMSVLQNGGTRPTLISARALSYGGSNNSSWTAIDQTSAKYAKVPAAPALPAFKGAWERPDSGILDDAHDGGNYVVSITETDGVFDIADLTDQSWGFNPTRSGNTLAWISTSGGNPAAQKTAWVLDGDTITASIYNYITPTVPSIDNLDAWVLDHSETWTRLTTGVPTLSATPLEVLDTDAAPTSAGKDVTVSRASAVGDNLVFSWDFAGTLDTTMGYDVQVSAYGPDVDHQDAVDVEVRYVAGAWVATPATEYNGARTPIATGVTTTVGSHSIAVTITRAALAATQTANVIPLAGDSIMRVHSVLGNPTTDYERAVKPIFEIPAAP